jgi:hypothetical protein
MRARGENANTTIYPNGLARMNFAGGDTAIFAGLQGALRAVCP